MLSAVALVKARKAIEAMYTGTCDVIVYEKVKRPNKTTGMEEKALHEYVPCRVSYQSSSIIETQENLAGAKGQLVKVFIAPELEIPAGSKIIITQDGLTVEYKASSERAHYPTHQEINLTLFDKWA